MAKRRTSGIQRRSRASDAALSRRVGAAQTPLDWRILLIGGILLVGTAVLLAVLLFGRGGSSNRVGQPQVNDGRTHITAGSPGGPYSSVPATSGPHWDTTANWGIYTTPAFEAQIIHNLEHGGIVVWYQPGRLEQADIDALTQWTQQQLTTERFKFILSPWSGEDFGHAIAVTSWTWLLYLDTVDTSQLDAFRDDHYGDAPEPFGGPGRPAI